MRQEMRDIIAQYSQNPKKRIKFLEKLLDEERESDDDHQEKEDEKEDEEKSLS